MFIEFAFDGAGINDLNQKKIVKHEFTIAQRYSSVSVITFSVIITMYAMATFRKPFDHKFYLLSQVVTVSIKRQVLCIISKWHFYLIRDALDAHQCKSNYGDNGNRAPAEIVDKSERQGEKV